MHCQVELPFPETRVPAPAGVTLFRPSRNRSGSRRAGPNPCITSPTATVSSTARTCRLRRSRASSGRPPMSIPTRRLRRHYNVLAEAFSGRDVLIAYAVKANSNLGVIATLASMGAGADVVSGGELMKAMEAGVPASRIVFSGVAKTEDGDEARPRARHPPVQRREPARAAAPVACRAASSACARRSPSGSIRMSRPAATPTSRPARPSTSSASPGTRRMRSTTPPVRLPEHRSGRRRRPHRQPDHARRTSPRRRGRRSSPSLAACARRASPSRASISAAASPCPTRTATIPIRPSIYARQAREVLGDLDVQLIFEPGRLIAGNAGVLISKVEYVKERDGRTFVVLDAGMNDLLRPALYSAHHEVLPVRTPALGAPRSRRGPCGTHLRKHRPIRQGPADAPPEGGRSGGFHDCRSIRRHIVVPV